ncbi:hypothetical protein [Novosphingobium sp.]|uniref:hypothetical protein n=1 Tax=Novosphingobium sp. TaxID=1874826 RepID=UPI0038BB7A9C
MASEFEPDDPVNDDPVNAVEVRATERPRALHWLWEPLYAKSWWFAAAAWWAGKVSSGYSSMLDEAYAAALAGVLNVVFFPPMVLLVLGAGYARAWFAWSDWELVEPTNEQMFQRKSVGGMRDPASDPLDARSGLHWQRFHRH